MNIQHKSSPFSPVQPESNIFFMNVRRQLQMTVYDVAKLHTIPNYKSAF